MNNIYILNSLINLESFKTIINIIFWITTVFLAFKTYYNAKKTLFNPIRSEMVKYQMKVITEFIDDYTSKGFNLNSSLDYSNLIKLNFDVDYMLYTIKKGREIETDGIEYLKYCEENLAGHFEIIKNKDFLYLDSLTLGNFDTLIKYIEIPHIKEKEKLHPELQLQRLYVSKKFAAIYSDLINLDTNPFIPNEIKVHLKKILTNIINNLHLLHSIIDGNLDINDEKTYNEFENNFNSKKINHKEDLENLRKEITKYFKVNNF